MFYSHLSKVAIIALMSSNIAFSGTMGTTCVSGLVTVPCRHSGWDLGAEALYLQPLYNKSLSYLGTNNNESGDVLGLVTNTPPWSWGFKLGASYYFNTGNDMSLSWFHLDKTSAQVNAENTIGFGFRSMTTNVTSFKPKWDAVNFEVGQRVNLGDFKIIRFYGGVQYANISTKIHNKDTLIVPGDYNKISMRTSNFGPRIGSDLSYNLGNSFSIFAKSAGALLVGVSTLNRTVGNIDFPETINNHAKNKTIIPEVEAKLGVNYSHSIGNSNLGLDIGYMWINYFNAQPVFIPFGPGYASDHIASSDFSVHGLFAGLKWAASS
ncbi:Lpg1974 family pore-forming outer membrane protein [Legionella saoudiensis]|uniref:Lpg1974 family pore-forming outer membrane protein n=1 Tax=Legionella saoudiensis TaxID=1750561 RepID=UPI000731BF19|nr:Lpg1974 family pore-forming outer membrane protein [Legionella saoudiensis]